MYAGIDPAFISQLESVRARLEKYGHQLTSRDVDYQPTEEMREVHKAIRAGKINNVRLLHVGKKGADNGTAALPFKTLKGQEHAAESVLQHCTAQLIETISFLRPGDSPQAMPFLNDLVKKVIKYHQRGVGWDDLGKYWASIMRRVSAPANSFHSATGGKSGANFNISWLSDHNEEMIELEDALDAAREERKRPRDEPKNGSPGSKKKPTGVKETQKEKQERKKKEADDKRKTAAANGTVARAAGVAAGPATDKPEKGHADWAAFKASHPGGKGANGKKDNMPACFDFHHGQGCSRGDGCAFHHRK